MQSNDGGQTWSQPRSIAETAAETDFPFLQNNGRGIFVSWSSKTEGYRLIPLSSNN
jgi:hypothetical protein